MAIESNVWGAGGLFEKALSSKLNRQDADAAATTQNAATNLLSVNNQYDLGLRRNEVDLGQLDVSRGQLDIGRTNADTNRSIADTQRFGAETSRANAMQLWDDKLPDAAAITGGGLRTFRAPSLLANNSLLTNKPFGMMNGGVALKPKMVKQPGYKNGGKVKMPKGYEKGGQIGDVENDEGKDTVDVKARPGEYFLNPKTVAEGFGDGDYEQGVRNLDEIVRETTGEEPGPVPVGKSGKPGFANSGVNLPALIDGEGVRIMEPARAPGTALVPVGQLDTGYRPNWGAPDYGRIAGEAARMGPNQGPQWQNPYAKFNPNITMESVGQGVRNAAQAVGKVLPSAETTLKWGGRAGKAVPVVGAAMDAVDIGDVATDPNMAGRDVAGEAAGKVAKWSLGAAGAAKGGSLGAAAGSMVFPGIGTAVGGAVGALGGGLLGYFGADKAIEAGRALRGVDTRDPSEYSKGVFRGGDAPAKPAEAKAAEKPKERDFDAEVAAKMAESEAKKSSLRDMFLDRIRANDANEAFVGSGRRKAENLALMKELAELEKAGMMAGGKGKDPQKDLDERLNKRYQRPVYDKDGNIKSFIEDPEMVTQIKNAATERGLNLFTGPNANQDNELRDLDRIYGAVRNFNSRVINQRGDNAERSDDIRKFEVRKGIGLRDTLFADKNAISIGDWWDAKWAADDDIKNKMVVDPKTGQTAAAQHVFRNPDGSLNYDAYRLYLQANEKKAAKK